jgi:FkbM family methyltransferase
MPDWYGSITRLLRAGPIHALSKRVQYLVPDVAVTRDVPELGLFRFRLRRHRWFLGKGPMAGHRQHIELYKRLLNDGAAPGRPRIAYDVGANIGYYARPLVTTCGAARVLAFEPMSENLDLLRANVRLGKHEEQITVFDLALSDTDGDEKLQIDDMSGGSAVLDSVSGGAPSQSRRYFGLKEKTETVRVAKLDTLVAQRNLPLPHFIKIDVEGAEAKVIAGARDTLRKSRARLAIALHGEKAARDTIAELAQIDYVAMGRTRGETQDRPLRVDDAPTLHDNNIIALPGGDSFAA